MDQLEGGRVHHNDGLLLSMHGQVDLDALTRAVGGVVARHAILRTAFADDGSGPVQRVVDPWPGAEIPVVDTEGLADADFESLYMTDMGRNLDLGRGEATRVTVYRRSDQHYVLVSVIHHLVCDLWSLAVFTEELADLYNAYTGGREPVLPALPMQYADYAARERKTLTQGKLDKHRKYWVDTLGNATPLLPLRGERRRPASQKFRGGVCRIPVPAETVARLRGWGASGGYTPFMPLLAIFSMLLAAESRSDDIVVSTPIATRTPQAERLIGCFLNVLVLRTRMDGIDTFRELTDRVRDVCLGAYAHQEMPFQQLVKELAPRRERSHAPIAQVALVLQNTPAPELHLNGLRCSWKQLDTGRSRLDFVIKIVAQPDKSFILELEYENELYEESWARQFGVTFASLMELAAEQPDALLGDLVWRAKVRGGAQASELVGPAITGEDKETVVGMFERQAALTPGAPAVTSDHQTLSYGELNARANRLARHLRSLGVAREVPVAVMLPRSLTEVVALLAVLKADGVYVPLDPDGPRLRYTEILSDVGARYLITDAAAEAGPLGAPGTDITLVAADEDTTGQDAGNLTDGARPEDLAYVMYTSGSTGTPKGVMISHQAFAARIRWACEELPLGPDSRVLRKAACTFDVAIWELIRALASGASSVLLPQRPGFDPRLITRTIEEHAVTDADFSPTALREILRDEEDVRRCRSLRRIISGVEALPPDLVRMVQHKLDAVLYNFYGPTETSVFCLAGRCRPAAGEVPLGVPVGGTYIRLLDGDLNPVARGDVGELCIGGEGLARGYVGRPDLTADRFVPDPGSTGGALIYRTGDLARINRDGEVEFHGRNDIQLNLHGYRIEPAEVEERLLAMDEVDMAAVVNLPDAAGEEQLTAIVVLAAGQPEFDRKEVMRRLRLVLPGYMVPTAYRFVAKIPVNANGKRDLALLPKADKGNADGVGGTAREPDLAPGAARLAAIWCDVLALAGVGADDNFLDLGGNSLDATRIAAQVRDELGRDLDVADIFDYPTVAELSAWLGL